MGISIFQYKGKNYGIYSSEYSFLASLHTQFVLGDYFRCGYGVKENIRTEIKWYEKAKVQGDKDSIGHITSFMSGKENL